MSISNTWKIDNESFITQQQPYCNHCVHHIEGLKCKAFNVIPDKIIFRDILHDEILPEQKGDFIYEPTEKRKEWLKSKEK